MAEIDLRSKWVNLSLLALAELLAMALWFSASAVLPQMTAEWALSPWERSWMTMAVQIGFVAGALVSALLNLSDRMPVRRLFAASCVLAAFANGAIAMLGDAPVTAILLRFVTGFALAGVYPPGMKLVATWCREDRGLGIGILVGALTVGSAVPHFLNAVPLFGANGMPPWRTIVLATSAQAFVAALLSAAVIHPGPFFSRVAPFDWRFIAKALSDRPTRLANFGYLGHMWELYAMWAWAPFLLLACYQKAGLPVPAARLAGFATVAVGGIGGVIAGHLADRLGRTLVTTGSLVVSGCCCLVAGLAFDAPIVLTAICLVWGFAVVADSAQFSAAVSELTDPRYVGTALTIQTSLGFLLTLVTIRLVPTTLDLVGWRWAFTILAIGPAFGIWSMLTLRGLPEAEKMASGRR